MQALEKMKQVGPLGKAAMAGPDPAKGGARRGQQGNGHGQAAKAALASPSHGGGRLDTWTQEPRAVLTAALTASGQTKGGAEISS